MANSLSNIKIASGVVKDYNADVASKVVSDKIEESIDSFLGPLSDTVSSDLAPVLSALKKVRAGAEAAKKVGSLVEQASNLTIVPKMSAGSAMTSVLTTVQQQI